MHRSLFNPADTTLTFIISKQIYYLFVKLSKKIIISLNYDEKNHLFKGQCLVKAKVKTLSI